MTENEQKLLDLFNEYNYIQAEGERDTYRPRSEKDWQGMSRPYKAYIVSKHFEFIKWLVKKDHINFKELVVYQDLWDLFNNSDFVIALLAVQEDPIRFLADILK